MSSETEASVAIEFGKSAVWRLPASSQLSIIHANRGSIPSIRDAMRNAAEAPINFPSLDQAIVPDDQVVLVVDSSIPHMADIASSLAEWICERGTNPQNLTIVLAAAEPDSTEELKSLVNPAIKIECHDASDTESLAYLAANGEADPIYLNRTIVDADFVIPIVGAQHRSTLDYLGSFGIYSQLSNVETRAALHRYTNLENNSRHERLTEAANQAAWWLGLMVGIYVVPGDNNQVTAIVAGDFSLIDSEVQNQVENTWNTTQQSADVIIMPIGGQQTWDAVARALHTASRFVNPGGSIVLCTEVDHPPEALRRLRETQRSRDDIAKQLAKDTHPDALAAATLLQTTSDYHVYLVSKLKSESVESLGVGVIQNEQQLAHLVSQHHSCLVLSSAQNRFWPS